jgi:hypothetical protein
MHRFAVTSFARWGWRGLAGLGLLFGLLAGPAAYADTFSGGITLLAPLAPGAAWTSVEYQAAGGAWLPVEAWQGPLDTYGDSGLRLKSWGVSPANAGQGPFRWVVYAAQGGEVWGVSENFNLPSGSGGNIQVTVQPGEAGTAAPISTPAPAATPTATPEIVVDRFTTGAPHVTADISVWVFPCGGTCDHSLINVYLPNTPLGSAVTVEYKALDGTWTLVDGWQTTLRDNPGGTPFVQWTVFPENYYQSPFRWVVTQPDGAVWGISPDFRLPGRGGNLTMFLLRP